MRARLAALLASVASPAGHALRTAPGVLGALFVCVGAGLIYTPLAFLTAGGFLLLIDRRIP